MSELLFKSFQWARDRSVTFVKGLDESIIDVQPKGFNNTIHWHAGHMLTVAEQVLFRYPKKSSNLPPKYVTLFAGGTKPADWQGEVPSLQELSDQLEDQLARMKEIPAESFNQKLKTPFLGCDTFGELVSFAIYHEALHLGKIQEMIRVINLSREE